jgi:release factor glutamine methyltransferase
MTTIAGALREASLRLAAVDGTGRLDATRLLEHVTRLRPETFVTDGSRELVAAEADAFAGAVERRLRGVPVAYITGSVGFYGRTFAVDERVLVPRPETEHLIDAALADLRFRAVAGGRIADIGTGSGAIAITLAGELPGAWVFGTDVSLDAVAVARRNAARNGVFQQCTFVAGDLAAPLGRFAPFDALVANLPYIPTAELPAVPDPAGFEPRLALDGGPDGLALYRRLVDQLPALLAPDASAFLEAAPGNVAALAAVVAARFPDAPVDVGTDYARLGRFVRLRRREGGRRG